MKRVHPGVWIGAIGLVFGFSGLGVGAVAVSQACRTNGDCAEWVQALGSLVALLVAILVPVLLQWRQSRERDERDRARARTAALQLLPRLQVLRQRARAVSDWNGVRVDGVPRFTQANAVAGQSMRIEEVFSLSRESASSLGATELGPWDSLMPYIDALGPAGLRVQVAVKMVRDVAAEFEAALAQGGLSSDALSVQRARSRVRECELAMDRAVRDIEALFPKAEPQIVTDDVVWTDRRTGAAMQGDGTWS